MARLGLFLIAIITLTIHAKTTPLRFWCHQMVEDSSEDVYTCQMRPETHRNFQLDEQLRFKHIVIYGWRADFSLKIRNLYVSDVTLHGEVDCTRIFVYTRVTNCDRDMTTDHSHLTDDPSTRDHPMTWETVEQPTTTVPPTMDVSSTMAHTSIDDSSSMTDHHTSIDDSSSTTDHHTSIDDSSSTTDHPTTEPPAGNTKESSTPPLAIVSIALSCVFGTVSGYLWEIFLTVIVVWVYIPARHDGMEVQVMEHQRGYNLRPRRQRPNYRV